MVVDEERGAGGMSTDTPPPARRPTPPFPAIAPSPTGPAVAGVVVTPGTGDRVRGGVSPTAARRRAVVVEEGSLLGRRCVLTEEMTLSMSPTSASQAVCALRRTRCICKCAPGGGVVSCPPPAPPCPGGGVVAAREVYRMSSNSRSHTGSVGPRLALASSRRRAV